MMMVESSKSFYLNPVLGIFTTDVKNIPSKQFIIENQYHGSGVEDGTVMVYCDWEKEMAGRGTDYKDVGAFRLDRVNNSIILGKGANTIINGFTITFSRKGFDWEGNFELDPDGYQEMMSIGMALDTLIRLANKQISQPTLTEKGLKEWSDQAIKGLKAFGIDTSKEFYVNGTKFVLNSDGVLVTQDSIDAQKAFEIQCANNRTYTLADDKTKKWIHYVSNYCLSNVPNEVKQAWEETLEETGVNPFPAGYTSTLALLMQEKDFATGGNNDLFGNTIDSAKEAVEQILNRIDNPIGVRNQEFSANEKKFYTALLAKLEQIQ